MGGLPVVAGTAGCGLRACGPGAVAGTVWCQAFTPVATELGSSPPLHAWRGAVLPAQQVSNPDLGLQERGVLAGTWPLDVTSGAGGEASAGPLSGELDGVLGGQVQHPGSVWTLPGCRECRRDPLATSRAGELQLPSCLVPGSR